MLEKLGKWNCYILRATGGSYIDETQILKRNPSAPLSLSSEKWPRDLGEARSLKRFWPWNGAGETWSDGVACSHWKELCTRFSLLLWEETVPTDEQSITWVALLGTESVKEVHGHLKNVPSFSCLSVSLYHSLMADSRNVPKDQAKMMFVWAQSKYHRPEYRRWG